LSANFGLGYSSEQVCLIPTTETINAGLKKLFGSNAFGFEDDQKISDREYVDRFIDLRRLPMAPLEERDSVHDWSYHFVTFLFPEYIENVRLTLAWIRENIGRFSGDVVREWNYYGHTQDASGAMKGHLRTEKMPYTAAIYRQMAISLDVTTAKIVQILCLGEQAALTKCNRELNQIRTFFKGVTPASLKSILWLEKDVVLPLPPPGHRGFKVSDEPLEYFKRILSSLDQKLTKFI
jgi:hypothetical protein